MRAFIYILLLVLLQPVAVWPGVLPAGGRVVAPQAHAPTPVPVAEVCVPVQPQPAVQPLIRAPSVGQQGTAPTTRPAAVRSRAQVRAASKDRGIMYYMLFVGIALVLAGIGFLFWAPVWGGLSMLVAGAGIVAIWSLYVITFLADFISDSWEIVTIKTLCVLSIFGLTGLGLLAAARVPFMLTFASFNVAWMLSLGLTALIFSMLLVLSHS